MNKYKIKETDVNMYEYRGYTISGNDRIGYVCISPYGAVSCDAYIIHMTVLHGYKHPLFSVVFAVSYIINIIIGGMEQEIELFFYE